MYLRTSSLHPITGWPRTITYMSVIVPHVMADLPVSPPCSPREEGEVDDYIPEYDRVWALVNVSDWTAGTTRQEIASQNKRHFGFQKNSKRGTISKNMRRMGRLKQPGGSSCNQRR